MPLKFGNYTKQPFAKWSIRWVDQTGQQVPHCCNKRIYTMKRYYFWFLSYEKEVNNI